MTRKEYDKLVRDLIPDIISQHGSTCGVDRLDEDEAFRGALRAKLIEEAREAAHAPDAELATELADLLEVVDAIVEAYGLTSETVRALQQERRAERGGFTKRVRLLWTNDSPE
jgi:predicted house-cleaning noncanonical NTP pyrophosphatase (MazG superfamily)